MTQKTRAHIEEMVNAITHGFGAIMSAGGLVLLLVLSIWSGDPWKIAGAAVFGLSLVFLYLASTGYHFFHGPRIKRIMLSLDHAGIYFLIAGTYTPFLLVNMRGFWGWTLFTIVWTAAVTGSIVKIFYAGRYDTLSVLLYLAMGWVIVIAAKPAIAAIPLGPGCFILTGGLLYTLGTAFYQWERLPFHHAIWHLFVLGGSLTHFIAVLLVVGPAR